MTLGHLSIRHDLRRTNGRSKAYTLFKGCNGLPLAPHRESNSRRDPQALLKRSGKFRHFCYDCRQLKGLKAVVGRTLGLPVVLQRGLAWLVGLVQVKQVMYVVLVSITKKS